MGQKINPVSLRLQSTNRHFDSCWYSNYFYKNLINKDILLKHYLNNFLKLLKLPTGRYSIQHLQKKTQIYNFLCYPKSTREWRSKILGLTKNISSSKKNRYFFKNKIESKRKVKKYTKLNPFFTTLNQLSVHKIQKKITSFQNFRLWSALNKKSMVNYSNAYILSTKICLLTNQKFFQGKPLFIKKINQETALKNLISSNISYLSLQYDNSTLIFLENLFVYKTLKANLKIKNQKKVYNLITPHKTFFDLDSSMNFFDKLSFQLQTNPIKNSNNVSKSQALIPIKLNFNTLELKSKSYLESSLSSFFKMEIDLIPFKVKNDWQHASYLADEIVYFLEKRIAFRRLKTKILKQLSKIPEIRGVRITCSGRVGGKSKKAQRAKTECIKYGQTCLQVFSSKIDFSLRTAFTSFGSVGVKIWICYN